VAEFKLGQRRSLDGVRGLAILFVLLSHVQSLPFGGGFIGVDLFFVLSGFLITTLLLEERRETGTVSLKAFYVRRALRLLPALVAMLAAMVVLVAVFDAPGEAANARTSAVMTLLYSSNWFMAYKAFPYPGLFATWSLSVEEQFYLVWPLLLITLMKLKFPPRGMVAVVAAGMLLSAGLRALLWKTTGSFERVFFGSDTHADGLLAGSLAGLLLSQGWVPPSRLLKLAAHVVLGVLILFLYWGWLADDYVLAGGLFILNLGMTALVVALVRDPGPLLLGFFEFGPLAWLGRISYGVYLWHMVLFGWSGRVPLLKRAGSWPLTIALTIAVAALSFYLLERPLLRLKRRFSRVSPQSP
jgi:peptidoglycan/LPS O-acetylase OafA/YrhL